MDKSFVVQGAVAQLGERLNGIQEAVSSILSSSTRNFKRSYVASVTSFFCRRKIPAYGTDVIARYVLCERRASSCASSWTRLSSTSTCPPIWMADGKGRLARAARNTKALPADFHTQRDALEYIMESFPIVKRGDEKACSFYRIKEAILRRARSLRYLYSFPNREAVSFESFGSGLASLRSRPTRTALAVAIPAAMPAHRINTPGKPRFLTLRKR